MHLEKKMLNANLGVDFITRILPSCKEELLVFLSNKQGADGIVIVNTLNRLAY